MRKKEDEVVRSLCQGDLIVAGGQYRRPRRIAGVVPGGVHHRHVVQPLRGFCKRREEMSCRKWPIYIVEDENFKLRRIDGHLEIRLTVARYGADEVVCSLGQSQLVVAGAVNLRPRRAAGAVAAGAHHRHVVYPFRVFENCMQTWQSEERKKKESNNNNVTPRISWCI
ncbi:unnamed protein product [Linum tenue]|uniref:Uncharacterized protein n=1 Tax=Linum tenue TaxID=586396 RepID=A0AAV0GTL8_9ROSI|nr:unnamed protein product [Linum tenue]